MPAGDQVAADVAAKLTAFFLENGNYVLAGPGTSGALVGALPAGMSDAGGGYAEELGFEGLAVQSVGYEIGSDAPRVHIYVTKGSSRAERAIPAPAGEVTVKVDNVGKVAIRPELTSGGTTRGNLFLRDGRIACGSSCSPSGENITGTLGALVRREGEGSALYLLSNNHVLAACNHLPVGTPIVAPSPADTAVGRMPPTAMAEHAAIHELRSGAPALVPPTTADVAIAIVRQPELLSSWQGDEAGFDTPTSVIAPASGMRVAKFGRTTARTAGTIESFIPGPKPMPYKAKHFTATVWYGGVWTVRADAGNLFALPGDSGSLVTMEDGSASVGLLFAATPKGNYGFMFPLDHVCTLVGGLTLVGEHGL